MSPPERATRRPATLVRTFKAVLWSFFGVRRGSDYEHDAQDLNPVHVIIAAVVAAALFVATLLLVVHVVLKS